MAHNIELSDEQYAVIERNAARQGVTPQTLVEHWVNTLPNRVVYDTPDDLFRALGATDEELEASERLYRETDWDTDE